MDDVNVCPARSTESSRRCSTLALLVCEILFLAFSTLGFTAVLCLKSIPYSCFTEFWFFMKLMMSPLTSTWLTLCVCTLWLHLFRCQAKTHVTWCSVIIDDEVCLYHLLFNVAAAGELVQLALCWKKREKNCVSAHGGALLCLLVTLDLPLLDNSLIERNQLISTWSLSVVMRYYVSWGCIRCR